MIYINERGHGWFAFKEKIVGRNGNPTRPVFVLHPDGCYECQGAPSTSGYAMLNSRPAHIVVWEWFFGRIAEGMQLHHRCKNRRCVNVEHLQLVTPKQHQALHAGDRREARSG